MTWLKRIPGMIWFNLTEYKTEEDAVSDLIHTIRSMLP